MTLYGGVEAGGTKFVCEVAASPSRKPRAALKVDTTTPEETLNEVEGFFREHNPDAVGIASFGPIDINRESRTFGYITGTPKQGWSDTDLAGRLQRALGVRVGFDTDVNAAAMAEAAHGAAKGLSHVAYLTVGTGVGGGAIVDGEVLHGLVHPEMGHLPVRRCAGDEYEGSCPFHHDCLEGMASGPAMEDRWKVPLSRLPAGHRGWSIEACYLAQGICSIVYLLSPRRVVCGGGVMHHHRLFPLVRERVIEILGGYVRSEAVTRGIDRFIVPPGLGDRSGVVGALELARLALASR